MDISLLLEPEVLDYSLQVIQQAKTAVESIPEGWILGGLASSGIIGGAVALNELYVAFKEHFTQPSDSYTIQQRW